MGFFSKKDGPGKIRIKYCGYIKGRNGTVTDGIGSQIYNLLLTLLKQKSF
jgi:hypothetical protein